MEKDTKNILLVHNHYGDGVRGGEEWLVRRQAALLRAHGHTVTEYYRKNSEFSTKSFLKQLQHLPDVIWSDRAFDEIQRVIRLHKPDIMHVHNYWLILSPSIFRAAKEMGVATVHNVNNYGLTACINGMFLRDGKPCEECVQFSSLRGVLHACYGQSHARSLLRYLMIKKSYQENVWKKDVDAFFTLTAFGKKKIVENGIPEKKVHVINDFVQNPFPKDQFQIPAGYGAIAVSRLSPEKGLFTLLKAWRNIDYPLTIVGDGPLRQALESLAPPNVKFTGFIDDSALRRLWLDSAFTVFPSECYEGFGSVIVESMSYGRLVVATDLGSRPEIIQHGYNGLLYKPLDPASLTETIQKLIRDGSSIQRMGKNARITYLKQFDAEVIYKKLIKVYQHILSH